MEILVCVKRVPTVGGKIAVTPDGQEVDTRMSGFSISPHEECAVEEAVQITEQVGGSVSVLTLGPEAAIEQLRGALALGAGRAVLLETDGREFGPIATASAIAAEVRSHGYDLVLLGNEAADTGDYQVGVRLAHELGWPVATGIKNLSVSADGVVASREYRGMEEAYELPLPAVITVKEGINLPRYPSLPGRLRAKRAAVERSSPAWEFAAEGLRKEALRVPASSKHQATVLGNGANAVPELVRVLDELGILLMTVLCLTELDGGAPADASLRALTLGRSLGDRSLAAVVFADSASVPASALADYGVTGVYVIEPSVLEGYAPQAWARALAGLAAETGATAVLAAGTDRGNEVLAHLGAITGLPMAANCTLVTPDGGRTHRLVRHRWAGLLLEDAVMEAPIALFTVATDAVAPVPADVSAETPPAIQVHVHKPELAEADLVVRAVESPAGAGGVSLATARVVVGGGRGVGGADGFAPLEELADLLGGVVGVSRVVTSEGWRPHKQQVGQTGTKITPELYLACGISGAIQHIAGCAGAKHIIAINTDPGAPILTHADYAIIGDLHQVIPALVAALRAR